VIRLFNQEGHHLDMHKKYHLVNMDKSIWTSLAWLGWFFLLTNYLTIDWSFGLLNSGPFDGLNFYPVFLDY
jgi:hypothetical protein